jgi:hypothetical protein
MERIVKIANNHKSARYKDKEDLKYLKAKLIKSIKDDRKKGQKKNS